MILTKAEVVDWKNNAVTKKFFSQLKTSKQDIMEFITGGGTIGETTDQTAQELAGELGKLKALNDILEYSIEDMIDEAVSIEEDGND